MMLILKHETSNLCTSDDWNELFSKLSNRSRNDSNFHNNNNVRQSSVINKIAFYSILYSSRRCWSSLDCVREEFRRRDSPIAPSRNVRRLESAVSAMTNLFGEKLPRFSRLIGSNWDTGRVGPRWLRRAVWFGSRVACGSSFAYCSSTYGAGTMGKSKFISSSSHCPDYRGILGWLLNP